MGKVVFILVRPICQFEEVLFPDIFILYNGGGLEAGMYTYALMNVPFLALVLLLDTVF